MTNDKNDDFVRQSIIKKSRKNDFYKVPIRKN